MKHVSWAFRWPRRRGARHFTLSHGLLCGGWVRGGLDVVKAALAADPQSRIDSNIPNRPRIPRDPTTTRLVYFARSDILNGRPMKPKSVF